MQESVGKIEFTNQQLVDAGVTTVDEFLQYLSAQKVVPEGVSLLPITDQLLTRLLQIGAAHGRGYESLLEAEHKGEYATRTRYEALRKACETRTAIFPPTSASTSSSSSSSQTDAPAEPKPPSPGRNR